MPRNKSNRGGSYIDSPEWIKGQKGNTLTNKKNKCFQYAVTVALSYDEIKKDPQRTTKIKPFINKYNWEGINFLSQEDDWKKFEKNNVAIAVNVLYAKKREIYILLIFQNITQIVKNNLFF